MKQGSTMFLRAAVLILGLIVLALCIWAAPVISKQVEEFLNISYLYYFILGGLYATALSFFFALYQAFKLLNYVDNNTAFSELSIKALKNIKYSVLIISILYAIAMPVVYLVAEKDDAPGLIVIGMMFVTAPIVIAVFTAVLQKLLQNAIDIKKENDLTV